MSSQSRVKLDLKSKLDNQKTGVYALFAFAFSFVLLFLLNLNVEPNRQLLNEFAYMFSPYQISGLRTTLLDKDYYTGGFTWYSWLILYVFKDRDFLFYWNVYLSANALIRAIPAIPAAFISSKYFGVKGKNIFYLGVVGALFVPSTAAIIDNSPFIICLMWFALCFYLGSLYEKSKLSQAICYYCCWIVLILMSVIDFKSSILIVGFAVTTIVQIISCKAPIKTKITGIIKAVLHIVLVVLLLVLINKIIFDALYADRVIYSQVIDSPYFYIKSLRRGLAFIAAHFLSYRWLLAIVDVLLGNALISSIFSLGLFSLMIAQLFVKKDSGSSSSHNETIKTVSLFLFVSFICASLFLYLENAKGLIELHRVFKSAPTPCYSIESYAYLFGPISVVAISQIINSSVESYKRRIVIISSIIVLVSYIENVISFDYKFIDRYAASVKKWFGPYTSNIVSYCPTTSKSTVFLFFTVIILVVLAIDLIIILDKEAKIAALAMFLASSFFYIDYIYLGNFDVRHEYNLWNQVNAAWELTSDIRYNGVIYSDGGFDKASLLKLAMPESRIERGFPTEFNSRLVIHTNQFPFDIYVSDPNWTNCSFVILDSNEYVISNDQAYLGALEAKGFEVISLVMYKTFDNLLNLPYLEICGVNAPEDVMEFYRQQLLDNEFNAGKYLLMFFESDEFNNFPATRQRKLELMYIAFTGQYPDKETLVRWALKIEAGYTYADVGVRMARNGYFWHYCEYLGVHDGIYIIKEE